MNLQKANIMFHLENIRMTAMLVCKYQEPKGGQKQMMNALFKCSWY